MDWIRFLDDHGIEYVTRGPNTKKGEVSINCPFCAGDDPSHHLGINFSGTGSWGCLRDPTHRGIAPFRLIQALTGDSYAQARLTVAAYSVADPDRLLATGRQIVPTSDPDNAPEVVPDFKAIKPMGSTAKFWRYVGTRGLLPEEVVQRYHLTCCLTGRFKDRLIFKFYQAGELTAWQGRAIGTTISAPRYLSSKNLKKTIFGEDTVLDGGEKLFITEGPFDAMKVDHHAPAGMHATCTFGVTPSIDQIAILHLLKQRYKRVIVLFDADAVGQAFGLSDWLQGSNVTIGQLPFGVKDPCGLTMKQLEVLYAQ